MIKDKFTATGVLLVIICLLFFIWPIPHTITIKDILLFSSLLLSGYLVFSGDLKLKILNKGLRWPSIIFVMLTLWIVIGAVFISDSIVLTLEEVTGQWFKGIAALLIGIFTALLARDRGVLSSKSLYLVLFAVLILHILFLEAQSGYLFLSTGVLQRRLGGLTIAVDKINYLTLFALSFVIVEIYFRAIFKRKIIPLSNLIFSITALILFCGILLQQSRFGILLTIVMISSILIIFIHQNLNDKRIYIPIVGVILLCMVFGYLNFRGDARWRSLVEIIPIALDTETNKTWLDLTIPPPKLKGGEPFDYSNYLRVAWMKEGFKLLLENPLGIGFDRSAFKKGMSVKTAEFKLGHSHSGIIDFSVGVGIPGLVLWLAFFIILAGISIKRFIRDKNYHALLLFFVLMSFGLRMWVDSIIRDHMLQQFFFLVGVISIFMIREENSSNTTDLSTKDR